MLDLRRFLRRGVPVLVALTVGVAAAGCEDPSNVGLGLIGESGGDPVRMHLPSFERPYDYEPSLTSNVRTSLGYSAGAVRVLAGTVNDPLFGTIAAKGYIDVTLSSSQSSDYRNGTITSVQLELQPNYVYGDSVATTSVVISEMQEAWPSTAMTSDTTLPAGVEITRVDFSYANDTSLVVDFPEEWFSSRSAVLLSANILDEFHGFELSTTDPAAVVGFDATSGIVHIVTTTGTADLVISKIFTHLDRSGDGNIPDGRAAIQDGIGQNLSFSFDFQADSIQGAGISRAVIELTVDQASMDDVPENFYRPAPTQYDFLGVREDGSVALLRSAVLGADNTIRFVSSSAAAGESTIVRIIQQAAAGNTEFTEYRTRIGEVQAAINSVLVFAPGSDQRAPHAIVTATPNSF